MQTSMRTLLLGGAAVLWMSGATVVHADPIPPPNAADFIIFESVGTPGQYTLYNNSAFWSVYGFEITRSPDASGPLANRPGWDELSCFGSCFGNGPTFTYLNASLSNMVLNGTHSNNLDFLFNAVFATSEARLLLAAGELRNSVDITVADTPVPAALPLMGSVLGAGWWAMRRASAAKPRAPRLAHNKN